MRLKNRHEAPIGGFVFIDSRINPQPITDWGFVSLVNAVISIRESNKHLGLSTDFASVAEEVDVQNAYRMSTIRGGQNYITHPQPTGGGYSNWDGQINRVIYKMGSGKITVRRSAALGDVLAASVVCDRLIERGFDVMYQCVSAAHCILRRHARIKNVEEPNGNHNICLDGSYERRSDRQTAHFHEIFTDCANEQISHLGISIEPKNCRPKLKLSDDEMVAAFDKFKEYPQPRIFICPRSDGWPHRQVPDSTWAQSAKQMKGTVFWLGRHAAPEGIIDLNCRHVDNLIVWLAMADVLVSVDSGPLHIAAALGIPCVAIGQSSSPELHLNDQNDFITTGSHHPCLNCQQTFCPIDQNNPPCRQQDPNLISERVNWKLQGKFGEGVSCIIAIHRPEAGILNRCLECIIPQVDQVMLVCAGDSVMPPGVITHPKVQVIWKQRSNIGYGRKINFGARNTNGKYLLFLNDDCFLDPGSVEKMKEAMGPNTGMVCNLLRKPDGSIWHAGKSRNPGSRGWGHVDFGSRSCSIHQITEMENCSGCCVLVKREAHYAIDGFDEEFFLYAEDDMYALQLRKAGYKIHFTPFSTGVHVEHQSTGKTGDIGELCRQSNEIFDRKMGKKYFDHNAGNSFGNFNYT